MQNQFAYLENSLENLGQILTKVLESYNKAANSEPGCARLCCLLPDDSCLASQRYQCLINFLKSDCIDLKHQNIQISTQSAYLFETVHMLEVEVERQQAQINQLIKKRRNIETQIEFLLANLTSTSNEEKERVKVNKILKQKEEKQEEKEKEKTKEGENEKVKEKADVEDDENEEEEWEVKSETVKENKEEKDDKKENKPDILDKNFNNLKEIIINLTATLINVLEVFQSSRNFKSACCRTSSKERYQHLLNLITSDYVKELVYNKHAISELGLTVEKVDKFLANVKQRQELIDKIVNKDRDNAIKIDLLLRNKEKNEAGAKEGMEAKEIEKEEEEKEEQNEKEAERDKEEK